MQKLTRKRQRIESRRVVALAVGLAISAAILNSQDQSEVGREVAIPHHLQDGEEFDVSVRDLIAYGKKLFEAHFTSQEGAGRPLSKGTGAPLSLLARSFSHGITTAFPARNRTRAPAVTTSPSRAALAISPLMSLSSGSGSTLPPSTPLTR